MREANDNSVKKRSLSSYLSNVNIRREELEKLALKHKEEEEEALAIKQENKAKDKIQKQREEEEVARVRKEHDNALALESEQNQTVFPECEVNKQRESSNVSEIPNNEILAQSDLDRRPDITSYAQSIEDTDTPMISGHTISLEEDIYKPIEKAKVVIDTDKTDDLKKGEDKEKQEITDLQEQKEDEREKDAKHTSITKSGLISVLKEPVRKFSIEDNGSPSSSEEEVESDAPTEVASPPRPRLNRLVRYDQMKAPTISPNRQNFDNKSDSELSDIDELRNTVISSSILRGDSSPSKIHNHNIASSPNSNRLTRKHASTIKKQGSHIAVAKSTKPKKGIYRDAGGRSKLQIACDKGKYELVQELLEEGEIDVNDQDNAGNSSLHEAALNGYLDCVKLLIEYGANVNLVSYQIFNDTPLIDAAANCHLDVVKFLLLHGADPTISNAKGLTAYESIEEESEFDSEVIDDIRAMKECLRDATENWKSSDHIKNEANRKLITSSPRSRLTEEHIIEDEFYWTDITSRAGKEKLFRASKDGNLTYVGLYLENGGRVDFKSFLEAVKFGHEDITSLFLAFGAQVDMSLKDGTTALMCSVGKGHINIVKLLLEAGADPKKKDKKGKTAFYYAKNSSMGVVDEEELSLFYGPLIDDDIDNDTDGSTGVIEESEKEEESNISSSEEKIQTPTKAKYKNKQKYTVSPTDGKHIEVSVKKAIVDAYDDVSTSREDETHLIKNTEDENSDHSENEEAFRTKKRKIDVSETPILKVKEGTEEEREKRLKEEEEYRQRRLQQKKKREQELLHKLADDEQKRVAEKEKQRIEETKRIEEEKLKHERELIKEKEAFEVTKRRKIRELYPLGLKLINFQIKNDYNDFLPLYYIIKDDGLKYVFNLQISILLKDTTLFQVAEDRDHTSTFSDNDKIQLWNLMKFIYLYGGNHESDDKKYYVDFSKVDLSARMDLEKLELEKFCKLPMEWIKWDDITGTITDIQLKEVLEENMVRFVPYHKVYFKLSTIGTPSLTSLDHNGKPAFESLSMNCMPIKFQNRKDISKLLKSSTTSSFW